ncbi:GNAT family N-acetyltransferase [Flavobacterium sp. 3HN19-14]|uniref:GNAT family N-acetyltransferase n=1 Tax=Flavobacterium sp. 3HN19-14 TaxID=3448133 RepID=UPI003EE1E2D1
MVIVTTGSIEDFPVIRQIAHTTWPIAYGAILPMEQLDYMLGLFYTDAALTQNLVEKGHLFLLAKENENVLGFTSFEHNYSNKNVTHIHKLYILPETQGKGIGKLLIEAVEKSARHNNSDAITLNVNRFNKAQEFYRKSGFEITETVDIQLDHCYLMEDFIMTKPL